MSTTFIVNADDFGWTDGQNLAVERAHRDGVLNRASLLCNGPAFDQAVEIGARCPELQIGVHLTLSEGRPLSPASELPNLTRPDGEFHDTIRALVLRLAQGRLRTEEVLVEWRAQIERARAAGLSLSHLDSHKHVHLFPPLLRAAISLAREYSIPYLRLPLESPSRATLRRPHTWFVLWAFALRARPHLRAAGLRFADHFVGVGESGDFRTASLLRVAGEAREGSVEIMLHPAVLTSAVTELGRRYSWAAQYHFEEELNALCDPRVVRSFGCGATREELDSRSTEATPRGGTPTHG